MNAADQRLLNDYQRDFPLVAEPFRCIADRLGIPAARVLERLARLQQAEDGAIDATIVVARSTGGLPDGGGVVGAAGRRTARVSSPSPSQSPTRVTSSARP